MHSRTCVIFHITRPWQSNLAHVSGLAGQHILIVTVLAGLFLHWTLKVSTILYLFELGLLVKHRIGFLKVKVPSPHDALCGQTESGVALVSPSLNLLGGGHLALPPLHGSFAAV